MIEKVYYELSLEQKFKKTNVRFKLKQYLKIAQKYFDQYQPFKMSEIETKERKKIESKVLGRYLEEDNTIIVSSYLKTKELSLVT